MSAFGNRHHHKFASGHCHDHSFPNAAKGRWLGYPSSLFKRVKECTVITALPTGSPRRDQGGGSRPARGPPMGWVNGGPAQKAVTNQGEEGHGCQSFPFEGVIWSFPPPPIPLHRKGAGFMAVATTPSLSLPGLPKGLGGPPPGHPRKMGDQPP